MKFKNRHSQRTQSAAQGKPMTEKKLAEILGMDESEVSGIVATLKEKGYLKKDTDLLIPLPDAPDLRPSPGIGGTR